MEFYQIIGLVLCFIFGFNGWMIGISALNRVKQLEERLKLLEEGKEEE